MAGADEIVARRPAPDKRGNAQNWIQAFTSALTAAGAASASEFFTTTAAAVETVNNLKAANERTALDVGEQAWVLLHGAAVEAMAWTIRDNKSRIGSLIHDFALLMSDLQKILDSDTYTVSSSFPEHPTDHAFFGEISTCFDTWLGRLRLDSATRQTLRSQLRREFAVALDRQLRQFPKCYADIESVFRDTPLSPAAQRAAVWHAYRCRLRDAVRRPVLRLGLRASGDRGRALRRGGPGDGAAQRTLRLAARNLSRQAAGVRTRPTRQNRPDNGLPGRSEGRRGRMAQSAMGCGQGYVAD